ncbi:MAG: AAA family ATPase [Pirellulaceae bacterium]
MKFEVPVLIESRTDSTVGKPLYHVRPLFFGVPETQDRELSKATRRLEQQLRHDLRSLARSGNHGELAHYTFAPHVSLHWLDLQLELKSRAERMRSAFATFEHRGRLIAFSPYLHDLWFEIQSNADLPERARSVLKRHFRDLENQQDKTRIDRQLTQLRLRKKPWLSVVELEINTEGSGIQRELRQLAFLGGETEVDGAEELERVGRLLNELYPDELVRAVRRDGLVQRLRDLLEAADNRPVLLVGSSLVGKTALIHEVVYRQMSGSKRREPGNKNIPRHMWHIAPQRIVTGMSYVGQWENRWLAILKHVRKRRYVLYLDDLLGLFQAGMTRQSDLSAAAVLKPFLERREIRVLAEIRLEQLRVLRERDRGFLDMFHIVQVEEPSEETALKIQLGVIRSLETRLGTRFDLEVLPTVLDLARRYQPYAAFPGKAAVWLRQLAVKYKGREVKRDDVIQEFLVKSGLKLAFADTRGQLRREEVVNALQSRIIGQQDAVAAMADVVSIAKARLNDPGRPLGSLFFLGPTGVGKTECAKALARYLFSDESRLLRFDMNEFVSPDAAARLVGSFDQPDGLLTSAIRHQPFCVLLFDEIEKAHPDVFDLLLQILGEARLTDAQGRPADFSNAVVLLTSNLGTREASRDLGFATRDEGSSQNRYCKAVQDFFRPEFFNRLDRIVPFRRLSREEMERIARLLIAEAIGRQGLRRRKCVVDISSGALERIVDRGYDAVLGARALRRSVEQELVSPLARLLAGVLPETPTVLEVFGRGRELSVHVAPLEQSNPWPATVRPTLDNYSTLVTQSQTALHRISESCQARRPPGEILASDISPELATYLRVREWIEDAKRLLAELRELVSASNRRETVPVMDSRPRLKRTGKGLGGCREGRQLLKELYSAEDVCEFLKDLSEELGQTRPKTEVERRAAELMDRLALLHAVAPEDSGWKRERALLLVRSVNSTLEERSAFACDLLGDFSRQDFGLQDIDWMTGCPFVDESVDGTAAGNVESGSDVSNDAPATRQPVGSGAARERADVRVILLEGYRAARLAPLHGGTHLHVSQDGDLIVYQVVAFPLGESDSVREVVDELRLRDEQCRDGAASNDAASRCGPFTWQPAVTLADSFRRLRIDFRFDRASDEGWFRLSRLLPLPPELEDR